MGSTSSVAVILGARSICELSDGHQHYFRSPERRSLQPASVSLVGLIADDDIFLSTLVLGEIRKGVELARHRDLGKSAVLERWLGEVESAFDGHVIGIDKMVSDQWGLMSAIRSVPVIHGLLAATALINGLTFATRNDRNITGLGVTVLNPFKAVEDRSRS